MPLRHDIRRGALLMVLSHALFTAMSAVVKALGDRIPVAELMFFRSALALPVVALILARGRGGLLRGLRTRRFGGHAARALTGTTAQACSFYALTVLPLAVQIALGYTTPLFVTVLAILFLAERVGVHRWSAVVAGFLGVLVIAAGQGVFSAAAPLGTAAAVAQGFFSAATTLLVRQLSATESSATITMFQSLLMTAFTLVALPLVWVTPTAEELALLVLVGLVGGVAQWMLTEAWASAQVSSVAPYSYSALVWSMAIGWAVWGEVPGLAMLAGSALIVAAGLYILHHPAPRAGAAPAEGRGGDEAMSIPFLREDGLAPGAVEDTAPGVRRVLCNNPSAFTFRGTNTWIIGRGRVAVLDPGPDSAEHLTAVLDALRGETVTHILVSHTHRDHSPGARALQAATGAPTHGFGAHLTPADQGGEGGDHGFIPDVVLPDGAAVEGEDWRVTALHTPGHCGNHLCFAMEGNGALFSADMVMSWSTSVVSPPDGDMAAYMRSLDRLIARGGADRLYLCGHGPKLPNPGPFLAALKAHRNEREEKTLAALRDRGVATAEALIGPVYGPLDPRLVGPAGRSLLAHLIKLEAEGVVARTRTISTGGGEEAWRPA